MRRGIKAGVALCSILILCGCGNTSGTKLSNTNKVEDTINRQIAAADAEENSDEDPTVGKEKKKGSKFFGFFNKNKEPVNTAYPDVDIDLTKMGGDMVYSMVNQLVSEPEDYVGQTVKMHGQYYANWYENEEKYYYFLLIEDAMACCSQGMEFVWEDGSHVYPDEYPENGSELEVVGVFDTYEEETNGRINTFCYLKNAEIKKTE